MKQNHKKIIMQSVVKIVGAVGLCLLCFFRNRILPQDNKTVALIGTLVTIGVVFLSMYLIFNAISDLIGLKEASNVSKPEPKESRKVLSVSELFAVLEREDVIDLILENGDGRLEVGTYTNRGEKGLLFGGKGSFGRPKFYYIEDKEYSDFSEFQTVFLSLVNSEEISVLFAGLGGEEISI